MTASSGHKADKLSYGVIEFRAMVRRYELGFRNAVRVDGKRLLHQFERGYHIVSRTHRVPFRVDLVSATELELRGAEARTTFVHSEVRFEILMSESTYRGVVDSEPHFIFTLAHELGHVFLHHDWLLEQTASDIAGLRDGSNGDADHEVYEDTEWQANAFAGSFLMPAWLIAEFAITNPKTLSRLCGTSIAAATTRLEIFDAYRDDLLFAWSRASELGRSGGLERRVNHGAATG